ncbi:hypothetical protein IV102_26990 [bacterium]|nr:hypothetical protein [bacterium]
MVVSAASVEANSTTNKGRQALSSHDQFMQLMLGELTQQDPLKPMSTSELANQMLSLEQVKSTTALQNQLENLGHSLMLGASHLIGRSVSVLDPQTQQPLNGVVQALRSSGGQFHVVIDGQSYAGESITELR